MPQTQTHIARSRAWQMTNTQVGCKDVAMTSTTTSSEGLLRAAFWSPCDPVCHNFAIRNSRNSLKIPSLETCNKIGNSGRVCLGRPPLTGVWENIPKPLQQVSKVKTRSQVLSCYQAQKLGYNFPGLGPGYGRWLCVICGHFPASFSRYVAQMGPPGTANGRDRARKVGYDLSTKSAI